MIAAAMNWVLQVEVNGEWEECAFPTRQQAMIAFIALAADYDTTLKRAILFSAPQDPSGSRSLADPNHTRVYLN